MMLCPVHLQTALCYVPAAGLYIRGMWDDNNANRAKPLTYRQRNSMFGLVL